MIKIAIPHDEFALLVQGNRQTEDAQIESVRSLEVHGHRVVSLSEYQRMRQLAGDEIKALASLIVERDKLLAHAEKERLSYESLIEKERLEFDTYRQYGSTVNPYIVLHELYKGGKTARGQDLIKQDDFRDKNLNQDEVKRWITWLEFYEIIKFNGQIRFASHTWHKSKELVRECLAKERML